MIKKICLTKLSPLAHNDKSLKSTVAHSKQWNFLSAIEKIDKLMTCSELLPKYHSHFFMKYGTSKNLNWATHLVSLAGHKIHNLKNFFQYL